MLVRVATDHLSGHLRTKLIHIYYSCIADNRLRKLFEEPSYFSIIRIELVNATAEIARFKKDFNYDIVIQQALGNSTAIHVWLQ